MILANFCGQLAMYSTDFAEIKASPCSNRATENLKELLKVTNNLPKLIKLQYLLLRLLEISSIFLLCFKTATVLSALGFQCILRNSASLSLVVNVCAVI